jgi:putative tryptophan/tyrosine transport system substrate-binding protein
MARAQQRVMPVIGYLHGDSPQPVARLLTAFRGGLSETGYIEGQNVAIEYRWAQNDLSRIPELVADLVRRRVAVIATPGTSAAALAAKAATTTIPIVFSLGLDPVQLGLVASLNRPGGNITGVNSMSSELLPKRLGLLHELLPAATRFAVLVNAKSPTTESLEKDVQAATAVMGWQIEILTATTDTDSHFLPVSHFSSGGQIGGSVRRSIRQWEYVNAGNRAENDLAIVRANARVVPLREA